MAGKNEPSNSQRRSRQHHEQWNGEKDPGTLSQTAVARDAHIPASGAVRSNQSPCPKSQVAKATRLVARASTSASGPARESAAAAGYVQRRLRNPRFIRSEHVVERPGFEQRISGLPRAKGIFKSEYAFRLACARDLDRGERRLGLFFGADVACRLGGLFFRGPSFKPSNQAKGPMAPSRPAVVPGTAVAGRTSDARLDCARVKFSEVCRLHAAP